MPEFNPLMDVAYLIPAEKFIYKIGGQWTFNQPVGRDGIAHYLLERGMAVEEVTSMLKQRAYMRVLGADVLPGQPQLVEQDGHTLVNLWTPPTLQPHPGDFPRIERVLSQLCNHDDAGVDWLVNWIAFKIQNPGVVPKIAVVFATRHHGAGKGTIYRIIAEMLGPQNCAFIERGNLSNKFNARWAQKLFVLADEVMTADNLQDVSQRLKILIDSSEIELEGKGKDQRSVKNRLAWIFASNDPIAPVNVEEKDRRYSVFANHSPLPDEYQVMVRALYEPDKVTLTASFRQEIAAFMHALINISVNRELLAVPYQNEDRSELILANLPAHEQFFREVDEAGVDPMLERLISRDWSLASSRGAWDFGELGIAVQVVYQLYSDYCRTTGARALRMNKFGRAVRTHLPAWAPARNTVKTGGQRVNCYVVPRKAS